MAPTRIRLGIALALFATFSFTVADTTSKVLAGQGTPILQIVFARYAVPLAGVVAAFGPLRGRKLLRTDHPWLQGLRGLLLTAATACMVLAMRAMPIAEAQAISFVHPLLLTVLAAVVLGERVVPLTWVAVATGFAGLLLIVRPGGGFDHAASLLPLAMALSYSSYQMLTRRIAGSESPINSLFYVMGVGALACAVLLPLDWKAPDLRSLALLGLAGGAAGIGHFCMIRALGLAPASRLAPFAYVQMLWVVAFGALVFGAVPDRVTLVGIAVVVAGGLLATLSRRSTAEPPLRRDESIGFTGENVQLTETSSANGNVAAGALPPAACACASGG